MRRLRGILRQAAVQRIAVAAVLACLLGSPAGTAQAEPQGWADLATTVFRNYGVDEGLPNPSVTAIGQDGGGFLWIGTQSGLARWDGYRFRVYQPDPKTAGSLPDGYIEVLHTDRRGRLWIGTSAGGLARYDPDRDSFVTYPAGPHGLSGVDVWSIEDDGRDGLWIGTGSGLDHLVPETGVVTGVRHADGDPASLPKGIVYALLRDRHGVLWVGTAGGLVRKSPDADRFEPVKLAPSKDGSQRIWTLYEDRPGRIWVGTATGATFVPAGDGPDGADAVPLPVDPWVVKDDAIVAITADDTGEIWFATLYHGVAAVDPVSFHTRRIRHDPLLPQSLANDTLWVAYRDRTGAVCVGSDRGLSRHEAGQGAFLPVFGMASGGGGRNEPEFMSLTTMPDGRIWAGLEGGGVDLVDPAAASISRLLSTSGPPEHSLPPMNVKAIAVAAPDRIFLATERGLFRTDAKASVVTHVDLPGLDLGAGLSTLAIADGRLWVGGVSAGLWAVPLDSNASAQVAYWGDGKLTDPRVVAILPGTNGEVWVGARNGLNRIDTATGTVERILTDPADEQSLPAGAADALRLDGQGRLWVGTAGGGIGVLTERENGHARFRRIGVEQGLPNLSIDMLLVDAAGSIWVSTDGGLADIDPASFAVRAFRRAEGDAFANYWTGSGSIAPGGELLFGGQGGLTIVRPDRVKPWDVRPRVVVTEVRIGGRPVPASRFDEAGTAEALTVPPGHNSVAVEFAALDYSAPDRNRYAYRLDGFDRDWTETDATRRLASYTNLPPGHYTLMLRGSNRDGVWAEKTLSVPITVLPAWYQAWWFTAIEGLAALAIVVCVVQARTVALRHRQREMAQLVAERTASLQARTEELVEAQRLLEQIAYLDALTSLPNRRMFGEQLRQLMAQAKRRESSFALLLIDLDHFKDVNDRFGHDAGDALLVEAGARFKRAVREADLVARLGGDEFAVILTESGTTDAVEIVCRRIVELFVAPVDFKNRQMKTTPSIGIARYPEHGETEEALFKSADLALYEAKRSSHNTWRWFGGAAIDPVTAPPSL